MAEKSNGNKYKPKVAREYEVSARNRGEKKLNMHLYYHHVGLRSIRERGNERFDIMLFDDFFWKRKTINRIKIDIDVIGKNK